MKMVRIKIFTLIFSLLRKSFYLPTSFSTTFNESYKEVIKTLFQVIKVQSSEILSFSIFTQKLDQRTYISRKCKKKKKNNN